MISKNLDRRFFIVLCADSGTPTISDPGNNILNHLRLGGFLYTLIPGPSALTSAIVLSGLECSSFTFTGFLPQDNFKSLFIIKRAFLNNYSLILFESLIRLNETLNKLFSIYGPTRFVIIREISKAYETLHFGILGEFLYPKLYYRGECVIVIEKHHIIRI